MIQIIFIVVGTILLFVKKPIRLSKTRQLGIQKAKVLGGIILAIQVIDFLVFDNLSDSMQPFFIGAGPILILVLALVFSEKIDSVVVGEEITSSGQKAVHYITWGILLLVLLFLLYASYAIFLN